ncbi:hypothetical protein GCM10028778_12100 [Barrientosiimonas marina]
MEVGSGTGINFPYYVNAEQVTAVEPNPDMLKKSLRRLKNRDQPIHTHVGEAEDLPFPDNTFDTVIGTLVFCTIPEPDKAFAEIRRALKPDGKLLLFEHVRLEQKTLGKLQDILTPLWKHVCDGCCLNRNTLNMAKKADFHVENVQSMYKGLFLTIELTHPNT